MDCGRAEELENDIRILRVFGMWCPSCARSCESKVAALSGVSFAAVDFGSNQLRLKFDPKKTNLKEVQKTIHQLGFSSLDPLDLKENNNQETREVITEYLSSLAISSVLSMWITLLHFWIYLTDPQVSIRQWIFRASGAMCFFVISLAARPFIKAAWNTFKARLFSLDQVIVLGAWSLYLYSWQSAIRGEASVYFDSIAMTITILLIVRWSDFKLRTWAGSSSPYWSFLQDRLEVARVFPDRIVQTDARSVARGKVLKIGPGKVALDGAITQGGLWLNESLLTGESNPLYRTVGHQIFAGTEALGGDAHIEVTHPVGERYIDRIFLTSEGEFTTKSKEQDLLEKIYRYWIPILFLVAASTSLGRMFFFGENPLKPFALTLLIGCPCVFIVGTTGLRLFLWRKTLQAGIRIRDVDFFYKLKTVRHFIFDKTGTLTLPLVFKGEVEEAACTPELKEVAYQGLSLVKHPLSALFPSQQAAELVIESMETTPGEGTSIKLKDRGTFLIGRASFAGFPEEKGQNVFVSHNGKPLLSFGYEEILAPGIAELLKNIKRRGYKLILASGDSKLPTDLHALKTLFDECHLDCRPSDKKEIVEVLKNSGPVCFVGDGLNDTEALSASDFSVAVLNKDRGISPTGSIHIPYGEIPRLLYWSDYFSKFSRVEKVVLCMGLGYNIFLILLNATIGLSPMLVLLSFTGVSILSLLPVLALTRLK